MLQCGVIWGMGARNISEILRALYILVKGTSNQSF